MDRRTAGGPNEPRPTTTGNLTLSCREHATRKRPGGIQSTCYTHFIDRNLTRCPVARSVAHTLYTNTLLWRATREYRIETVGEFFG